jgi:hypothetical protein
MSDCERTLPSADRRNVLFNGFELLGTRTIDCLWMSTERPHGPILGSSLENVHSLRGCQQHRIVVPKLDADEVFGISESSSTTSLILYGGCFVQLDKYEVFGGNGFGNTMSMEPFVRASGMMHMIVESFKEAFDRRKKKLAMVRLWKKVPAPG